MAFDPATSTTNSDILHHFLFFDVLNNGSVHIFDSKIHKIPPSSDPLTGVQIKDVQISSHLSARLFLPRTPTPTTLLPVLLYVHGGGFCMRSAFNPEYTAHLTSLAAEANLLAISLEYSLFPTHPLPACYDDAWAALQWISARPDPWLKTHADPTRVFIAGDSAGGNICHDLAVRAGSSGGFGLRGMVLVHPYFGEGDEMWMYMCPDNDGPQDRRMKPAKEDLRILGVERVLVIVAEKDRHGLRDVGVRYAEELKESGWKGKVELVENYGKDHNFHLSDPQDEEALANLRRIVDFIHNVPES